MEECQRTGEHVANDLFLTSGTAAAGNRDDTTRVAFLNSNDAVK